MEIDYLHGEGVAVIVVAAGSGSRMGGTLPKQFMPLAGVPVLVRTVCKFIETLPLADIVVVVPAGSSAKIWVQMCSEWSLDGLVRTCTGGESRFASVLNALNMLGDSRLTVVHDGVRPLFSPDLLRRMLDQAMAHGTAVPAIEPADSFRQLTPEGFRVVARSSLRAIQTPQVFQGRLLAEAYRTAYDEAFTDDASVVERCGGRINLCPGEAHNIKITTPIDLLAAEAWLKGQ